MDKKKVKKSKYVFSLKNINTDATDKKFGIVLESNLNVAVEKLPVNTTKISDLSVNKHTPEIISFLDESKTKHKCVVSMIDFRTGSNVRKLGYHCFWDHHPIPSDLVAIGCPIKYVPSQMVKKYYSEISKDTYVIKENITEKISSKITDKRLEIIKKGFYQTDGAFCSFNCAMAFAMDNKHDSMYSMSETLLVKMYNCMYKNKVPIILEAPSYRVLERYGGTLNIESFRESFNKIEYSKHGIVTEIPICKSIGYLHEELIKF